MIWLKTLFYSLTIKIYVHTSSLKLVIQDNLNLCPQATHSYLAQNKQSCIPIQVKAMHGVNTSKMQSQYLEQIVKMKKVIDNLYALQNKN